MKIKTTLAGLGAAAALTALSAGATLANSTIGTYTGLNSQGTDVSFTGGVGGVLSTTDGGAQVIAVGPIGGIGDSFTGFFNLPGITELDAVTGSSPNLSALFSGGSFSILGGPTGTLLAGTFTGSQVTTSSLSSGSVLNVGLNSVTYTGGLFESEFNTLYGGTGAVGTLSISLSSINPILSGTGAGGGFAAFGARASSGTFDATPAAVPEPGTAPMVLGGLGVLGLMIRARKVRRFAGLDA